jgi:hypothetical protein
VIQASHDGTSDDEKGDLIFSTNDGSDGAAPTEAMRIDSAGKVGIGTDSPIVPLHVYTSGTSTSVKGNVSSTFRSGAAGRDVNIQLSDSSVAAYIGNLGGAVYIYTGSQQSLNIATDGDITVSAGNLVIGTAGKGIDFSNQASPAAGMTAELLDRYEEGTFTPAVTFGGGSVDLTYSHQNGAYTRIGRAVTVQIAFLMTAKGSSTGSAKVTGLPFTVGDNLGSTSLEASASMSIYYHMASLTDSNFSAAAINGGTYLLLYQDPAGAVEADEGNFTDTSSVRLTITYFV